MDNTLALNQKNNAMYFKSKPIRLMLTGIAFVLMLFSLRAKAINRESAVNSPPSLEVGRLSVDENQPAGTVVGSITITDPDGDVISIMEFGAYSPSYDAFILGADGTITLRYDYQLNYESHSSHTVEIGFTDGEAVVWEEFYIYVNDINEPTPAVPMDVEVVDISESDARAVWPVDITANYYDVEVRHAGTNMLLDHHSFNGGSLDEYVMNNLRWGEDYLLRARATNNAGTSDWTEFIPFSTLEGEEYAGRALYFEEPSSPEYSGTYVAFSYYDEVQTDFTIEFLCKMESVEGEFNLLTKSDTDWSSPDIALGMSDGKVYLEAEGDRAISSEVLSNPTGWHWFALTVSISESGSTLELYDMDELIMSHSSDNIIQWNPDEPWHIGNRPGAEGFTGIIDDFRIWTGIIDQEDRANHRLTNLEGDETGLAVYFDFDQEADAYTPMLDRALFGDQITGSLSWPMDGDMVTSFRPNPPAFEWGESTSFTFDEETWWSPTIFFDVTDDQGSCDVEVTFDSGDTEFFDLYKWTHDTGCEFEIAVNQLLDYEEQTSYSFVLKANDGMGGIVYSEVTINLNNLNDNPPEAENATFGIASTIKNGDEIGTVAASDPDGDELAFVILSGDPSNVFEINGEGVISVADASGLDFDNWSDYTLEVEVSDPADWTIAMVTITYNQPPVFDIESTYTYDEEAWWSPTIFFDVSDDQSSCGVEVTFDSGDTEFFDLHKLTHDTGCNFELSVNQLLDYEEQSSYNLTLKADDGQGGVSFTEITIELNNINDNKPTLEDQSFSIDENSVRGVIVGAMVAEDLDGDVLSFTITQGNTHNAFSISGSTGEITVSGNTEIDFEILSSYALTVEVKDGVFTTEALVDIAVNDLNEETNSAPIISDQMFTIDENSEAGSMVGSVSANDPDGNTLVYSITEGNEDEYFVIGVSSGEVTVGADAVLDFETQSSYSITVEVSDGELSAEATITINLNDVDESVNSKPIAQNQSFILPEHSEEGTLVGVLSASDADGDDLTFAITSGNTNEAFSLDQLSGQLMVSKPAFVDFETQNRFDLTIEVSDGIDVTEILVIVNLTDIEENNPVMSTGAEIEKGISVYPNPTASSFGLQGEATGVIYIYDQRGTLVRKENVQPDARYDVSMLHSGIYLVRVVGENTIHNSKLMIR